MNQNYENIKKVNYYFEKYFVRFLENKVFSFYYPFFQVPDYYDFIDKPMDFGTIKKKLNGVQYFEVQDFLDDINLVFQNCLTYNPPRSRVSREGAKLKSYVVKRLGELGLS